MVKISIRTVYDCAAIISYFFPNGIPWFIKNDERRQAGVNGFVTDHNSTIVRKNLMVLSKIIEQVKAEFRMQE